MGTAGVIRSSPAAVPAPAARVVLLLVDGKYRSRKIRSTNTVRGKTIFFVVPISPFFHFSCSLFMWIENVGDCLTRTMAKEVRMVLSICVDDRKCVVLLLSAFFSGPCWRCWRCSCNSWQVFYAVGNARQTKSATRSSTPPPLGPCISNIATLAKCFEYRNMAATVGC
jgi:hypothetical protein